MLMRELLCNGTACGQYISLKAKGGKDKTRKLQIWQTTRKQKNKELSMYRLRELDVDDKVCEQVSMTMLSEVYPKAVIERCVEQSEPWSTKARRVRASTALALVLFVIAMARSLTLPRRKPTCWPLGAAAINMGQGPIRRCAVCSWPSVAAMRWWGWRWAATMSRKCMGRTVYW